MSYVMSKMETEQWTQDSLVKRPCRIKTSEKFCRDLICQHAKKNGADEIKDCYGYTVHYLHNIK